MFCFIKVLFYVGIGTRQLTPLLPRKAEALVCLSHTNAKYLFKKKHLAAFTHSTTYWSTEHSTYIFIEAEHRASLYIDWSFYSAEVKEISWLLCKGRGSCSFFGWSGLQQGINWGLYFCIVPGPFHSWPTMKGNRYWPLLQNATSFFSPFLLAHPF